MKKRMFKKYFIIGGSLVVLAICVFSIVISYAFNHLLQPDADDPQALPVSQAQPTPVPFVQLHSIAALVGSDIKPEDFLADGASTQNLTLKFGGSFTADAPGIHYITLSAQDDTHKEDIKATIYLLDYVKSLEWESGSKPEDLTPERFITNWDILPDDAACELVFVTDIKTLDFNKTRRYEVVIACNGMEFHSVLNLVDSKPPSARPLNLTLNTGQVVEPDAFLSDIYDVSSVTVSFTDSLEPDWFAAGDQSVSVTVEDSYQNTEVYTTTLTVIPNQSPPVITGARDRDVLVGDAVQYRKDVSAADSFGNPLSIAIDSSAVDTDTPGVYPVTYSAVDANGNKTTRTIEVMVVEINEEALDAYVEAVLTKIIKDTMTPYEKARAIFNWVAGNIAYTSTAPKISVYDGAFRGLQNHQGDCYTFYAVSEVLLTQVGIDNMCVSRIGGKSNHYWNLVNVGDGWYHFDATPNRLRDLNRFMFTESEAEAYTERIYDELKTINFYTYDKTLYPDVAR